MQLTQGTLKTWGEIDHYVWDTCVPTRTDQALVRSYYVIGSFDSFVIPFIKAINKCLKEIDVFLFTTCLHLHGECTQIRHLATEE